MKKRRRDPYLTAGLLLTGALFAMILLSAVWTPYDPAAMDRGAKTLGPSLAHWMGTDNFGRDIFSRVMKGAGTTLAIALSTVAIGFLNGLAVGSLTGYFGGRVDAVLMRFNDALTAFPSILLGLVFVSVLGTGTSRVILALGLVFTPSFTRMVRSAYAACREADYVKSVRLMGASHFRILYVHILPNTRDVLLPAVTIGFNNAVLAEASMSYLGIGSMSSLGYMLSDAQGMLYSAPWYALSTGAVMVALIFGVGLIGEGLRKEASGRA